MLDIENLLLDISDINSYNLNNGWYPGVSNKYLNCVQFGNVERKNAA